MSKDPLGLLLLKIGTLLYSAVIIYRINSGIDHFWSVVILPVITALILWRPRIEGWNFLQVAFSLHFLYYGFAFFRGLLWIRLKLASWNIVMVEWGVAAALFLSAAIFISRSRHLFDNCNVQTSRIKHVFAVMAAVGMLLLPWIEQAAWNAFDPRVLDNKTKILGIYFIPLMFGTLKRKSIFRCALPIKNR